MLLCFLSISGFHVLFVNLLCIIEMRAQVNEKDTLTEATQSEKLLASNISLDF